MADLLLLAAIVFRAAASLQSGDLASPDTESMQDVAHKLQARLELRVNYLRDADFAQQPVGAPSGAAARHHIDARV